MNQPRHQDSDTGPGTETETGTDTNQVRFVPGAARQLGPRQLLIRFAAGAGASLLAALVSQLLGAGASGPLLALPTILIASLTLITREHGHATATDDAHGAVLGAVGMLAFAAVAWLLLGHWPSWLALGAATTVWALTSVALLAARRVARRRAPARTPPTP